MNIRFRYREEEEEGGRGKYEMMGIDMDGSWIRFIKRTLLGRT